MAYQIKDDDLIQKLRHLAKVRKLTVADVLRDAVKHEVERETSKATAMDRLQPVLARSRALGSPSPAIDWQEEKRRTDELWGE